MNNPNLNLLFPSFSNNLITQINQHATFKHIPPETILIKTGQYPKENILILNGTIKIYRENNNGEEFFMYFLHPGQACLISFFCLFKNLPSPIKAIVSEHADLIFIPDHLTHQWLQQHTSWLEFIFNTYHQKFQETLFIIDALVFNNMEQRLEQYIQKQKQNCNCNDLHISHQQIASDFNTSREVISRLLKKMEHKGLIFLHRNHISLKK